MVDDTSPTAIYTLSLHDALPICRELHLFAADLDDMPIDVDGQGAVRQAIVGGRGAMRAAEQRPDARHDFIRAEGLGDVVVRDRKSTRLNSSHSQISYAVFCLKKK